MTRYPCLLSNKIFLERSNSKCENLFQFERPEILVDKEWAHRVSKNGPKHLQVFRFDPPLKMAAPWVRRRVLEVWLPSPLSLRLTKCLKGFLNFVQLVDVVHVDSQHSHHSARVLLDFPAHQQLRLASLPSRLDCHYCATTTTTTAQTLTFPSHCCSDFSCRGSKPERVTVPVSYKNLYLHRIG